MFASAYTAALRPVLSGLPAPTTEQALSSVGAAIEIGTKVGGAAGAAIVTAAKTSFIHAMDRGLIVGALIALVGALVALMWLPSRAPAVDAIEVQVDRREGAISTVVERVEP